MKGNKMNMIKIGIASVCGFLTQMVDGALNI